ncbi:MAG: hypothetical protein ACT4PT_12495, partial [Methanobacteriota archaeon]
MRAGLLLAVLVAGPILSGCIGSSEDPLSPEGLVPARPLDPAARYANVPFVTEGKYSRTLETGPFSILPPEVVDVVGFESTPV